MKSQHSLLSRVHCKVVFDSQSLSSEAKKRFQMHPTENVGGEKGCVIGKGDMLVRTKRRYSLQWEKTFKVTYLVISHSLKSTNFLEEKRKTVTQPHTHTTRDQAKQHSLSQHMSKEATGKLMFLKFHLQIKDSVRCMLDVSILIWIRASIIMPKHFPEGITFKHVSDNYSHSRIMASTTRTQPHNKIKQILPLECELVPCILKYALYFAGYFLGKFQNTETLPWNLLWEGAEEGHFFLT